ncbi:MAG: PspC domain-containing protein, partial [Prevotella sp.]|nr:PspC domain-containing protein [Prevotella sp.]MBR7054465.1 PspC domain-containing protein [Prevotella sp.]
MKRNITINIFGTLYHIDEDAYELLQKYNDNMRRYYGSREGGEEIADDVEHRVAELMSELQSQGVLAITIDHVKEIINRIGDPQDMDDEDGNDTSSHSDTSNDTHTESSPAAGTAPQGEGPEVASTPDPGTRKLFRDPEDKILGGVMSGISHYLGIKDPLLPRVLMVLLAVLSFSTFAIIYLVAWVLIPEATTPEDRLRMYGKPVSAKAINEEMMRGLNSASQFVKDPHHRDTARGCFSAAAKFVMFCFGGFLLFILCTILFSILAAMFGIATAGLFGGLEVIGLPFDINFNMVPKGLLIATIVSALLMVGIPLFALTRLMFRSKDGSHIPTTAKVLLILLWMASIGVFAGAVVKGVIIVGKEFEKQEKSQYTRNGIYLPRFVWEALDREGWKVETLDNVNKYLDEFGKLPTGHGNYIHLESENPNKMAYNLNQESDLRPGTYKVDAYVRSDGEGNALYVVYNQGSDTLRVDIPPMEPTEQQDKTKNID